MLRSACPYDKRFSFLLAICEATEFKFGRALDLILDFIEVWSSGTKHLQSQAKELFASLFEHKGAELFDEQFSNVAKRIHQLSDEPDRVYRRA